MAGVPPHLAAKTVAHLGTNKHVTKAVANGAFWCGQLGGPGAVWEVWTTGTLTTNGWLAPPNAGWLVVEARTDQERVLLFDENVHGYDALFCDEPRTGTPGEFQQIFIDGKALLEIVCVAGYSIDYDDEAEDFIDPDTDLAETMTGQALTLDEVKDAGFDYFTIDVRTDPDAAWQSIVDAELA